MIKNQKTNMYQVIADLKTKVTQKIKNTVTLL